MSKIDACIPTILLLQEVLGECSSYVEKNALDLAIHSFRNQET